MIWRNYVTVTLCILSKTVWSMLIAGLLARQPADSIAYSQSCLGLPCGCLQSLWSPCMIVWWRWLCKWLNKYPVVFTFWCTGVTFTTTTFTISIFSCHFPCTPGLDVGSRIVFVLQVLQTLNDEVLAWLTYLSGAKCKCIWSSWCHCHTIISCFIL